jgi:hypothetical protein
MGQFKSLPKFFPHTANPSKPPRTHCLHAAPEPGLLVLSLPVAELGPDSPCLVRRRLDLPATNRPSSSLRADQCLAWRQPSSQAGILGRPELDDMAHCAASGKIVAWAGCLGDEIRQKNRSLAHDQGSIISGLNDIGKVDA